jgi:hypothetical protein
MMSPAAFGAVKRRRPFHHNEQSCRVSVDDNIRSVQDIVPWQTYTSPRHADSVVHQHQYAYGRHVFARLRAAR